ncbi:mechanosensitive ion channel family protein [Amycolatopsis sp. WGS_07]|uniref:mechanosensitive ion channel family protein n=1 Tax=Amycolatopsis sp. WGS_07 TaxID=3076764 RepID=UPI003873B2D3
MGEQLKDGLGQAWNLVATFVPKLVGFLIILLIGWLIAKAVSKALGLVLGKLGFTRMVEKTGLTGMVKGANLDATTVLVKLVYYFILLIALQLAFGVFGQSNPVSQLLNDIIAFLPRILVAVVLIIVAAAIAKVVRDVVAGALSGRPAGRLLSTVAYWLVMAFGIIAALGQVNIATSVTGPVLIAVLATAGGVIVVGFGGGLIKPAQERWGGWLANLQGQVGSGSGDGSKGQVSGQHAQAGQTRTQNYPQSQSGSLPQPGEQTRQMPADGGRPPEPPTPPAGFGRVDR